MLLKSLASFETKAPTVIFPLSNNIQLTLKVIFQKFFSFRGMSEYNYK